MMTDIRDKIRRKLDALIRGDLSRMDSLISTDAIFKISAPIGRLEGLREIEKAWLSQLRKAFAGCHRRDIIFLGSKDYLKPDHDWVACSTQYVGNFHHPFCGLRPSTSLAMLRAGEFYRLEDGRIAEARILFDLPDLMQQAGLNVFPKTYGLQHCFPAPATQDGLCPTGPGNADESHAVMTRMLRDLIAFDPETKESRGMTGEGGAWHDEMCWYGPAGIGATYRWEGFVKDHRAPFLDAFPTRDKGDTVCQLADHNYAALCGYGMPMQHMGSYFDLAPTQRKMSLPVMDFYRVQDGKLIENWVYLDYVDMFGQLGVNLLTGEGWG